MVKSLLYSFACSALHVFILLALHGAMHRIDAVEVPIGFACEFSDDACCTSALAAAQMSVADANAKNGRLIQEFVNLTQNMTLKLDFVLPLDSGATPTRTLRETYKPGRSPNSYPVAIVGGYYSSRVVLLAQICQAVGVSHIAWNSAPQFDMNPLYQSVFRIFPTDARAMYAIHSLLEGMNITWVALVATTGDTWGTGCFEALQTRCATAGKHQCTITPMYLPAGASNAVVESTLDSIKSQGYRCIVNMILTGGDSYFFQKVAYEKGMAGNKSKAKGFLWILTWPVWKGFPGSESFYAGTLVASLDNGGVKSEIIDEYEKKWRETVPKMRLHSDAGNNHLTVEQADSPRGCLSLSAAAYDSVARVRMGLENVNLSEKSWWGIRLMQALADPGVQIDGLIQGPAVRSGAPWAENEATFKIQNYVGPGLPVRVIYEVESSGSLIDGPHLSKWVAPGAGSPTPETGKLVPNGCNGASTGKCGNAGLCHVEPGPPGTSPGWCSCTPGYVGRHCRLRGTPITPPGSNVPTNFTIEIISFQGLTYKGDAFRLSLRVISTWNDSRFPYDTGEYSDTVARSLMKQSWYPRLKSSGTVLMDDNWKLKVTRDADASSNAILGAEPNVVLMLSRDFSIEGSYVADFTKFPFDKHILHLLVIVEDYEITASYSQGELVPRFDLWSQEWPLAEASIEENSDGDSISFDMQITVYRAFDLAVLRLLIPIKVLVVISWAGFWIPPDKLMPRFASGFISFLALQTFKNVAIKLMPNNGIINGISWIDIYISCCGIIMGMSVIQTVTAQFVMTHISIQVSIIMDCDARWAFPALFLLIIAFMFSTLELVEISHMAIVVHSMIVCFMILYGFRCFFEFRYFSHLLIRRIIARHAKGGAARYSQHKLTEPEIQRLYNDLDKATGNLDGALTHTDLFDNFIKLHPKMIAEKTLLRAVFHKHFGIFGQATCEFKGKMGIVCGDDGIVQKVTDHLPAHMKGMRKGNRIVEVGKRTFSKERLTNAESSGYDYFVTVNGSDESVHIKYPLFRDKISAMITDIILELHPSEVDKLIRSSSRESLARIIDRQSIRQSLVGNALMPENHPAGDDEMSGSSSKESSARSIDRPSVLQTLSGTAPMHENQLVGDANDAIDDTTIHCYDESSLAVLKAKAKPKRKVRRQSTPVGANAMHSEQKPDGGSFSWLSPSEELATKASLGSDAAQHSEPVLTPEMETSRFRALVDGREPHEDKT